MTDLDLDVDSPEKVAQVLRRAAECFHASASELESAWQDKGAGRPWTRIAVALERAAVMCDRALSDFPQPHNRRIES